VDDPAWRLMDSSDEAAPGARGDAWSIGAFIIFGVWGAVFSDVPRQHRSIHLCTPPAAAADDPLPPPLPLQLPPPPVPPSPPPPPPPPGARCNKRGLERDGPASEDWKPYPHHTPIV
jgi:hypothetical protein